MTIVEWFAVMGLVAFVGVGAIAMIMIGDYASRMLRVRKYKREKVCSFCKSCESIDWQRNQADCSRYDIKVIPSVTSCNKWRKRDEQSTAFDKEYFEYVMRLNIAYIDKVANTKDISKKKATKYIKEHLKASTRRFVNWSDE